MQLPESLSPAGLHRCPRGADHFADWAKHYFTLAGKRPARTSYARDIDYLNNHVVPRRAPLP